MKESYDKKQSVNDAFMSELNDNEEEDAVMEEISRQEKKPGAVKCPVDRLMFQNPYVSYKKTLTMARMKTLFKDSGVNNASELIFQYIAHFFYRNIVHFDVVNS